MKSILLALSIALAGAPAGAQWIPALVPNGSFERDTNRDGQPDEWAPAPFKSPAKFAWDRGVAHTGKASARVADSRSPDSTAWDANTARWVSNRTTECKPGETFSLRAWVKTDLTAGQATVVFAWFGGGKWLREDATQKIAGKTDWTQCTATVSAPEKADSVRVYLMLNAAAGQAWFDDVEMVRGPAFPGNFRPVDLRAACTTGFRDETAGDGKGGWTDQGANDAHEIPLGRQTWRGVPFEIADPAANAGRACVALRGGARKDLPASAEFAVAQGCDALYFLHGAAWAKQGEPVARYQVDLADGTTVTVPVRAGREVSDWWSPADTAESAAGWVGKNAAHEPVGLGIFAWRNPKPDVAVRRVRVEAAGEAQMLLAAVTAGDGPPVLEERPLDLEFTDTTGWYEWAFPRDDTVVRELDLSRLLDAPAGKHGFVGIGKDGHLVFQDGTRARFFGTNVGGNACCPEKAAGAALAQRLARHGVNMLRLHAFDSQWAGFFDAAGGSTRALRPDAQDRMDYFVAELLKRGIYVYMDLLDYRRFLPGDGVREAEEMGVNWESSIKGASIFDPRMIERQKEYATQLLTHVNPYTGRRYADEPGMALLEITNENSVFYLGNTKLMLPSYVEDLRVRWNAWLAKRYAGRDALAKAWTNAAGVCALLEEEDAAKGTVLLPLRHLYADLRDAPYRGEKSPARLNEMTRFLYEVEVAYYDEMRAHLRGLGVKCPITGTNQDFSDASNLANARCDAMTRNNYWLHPNVRAKPFLRYVNRPMVRADIAAEGNPVAEIASSTVAGKPMIVPEFNFPWPNEWRAECLPLMAAYGRLQDWDGLLYFAHGRDTEEGLACFNIATDPVRWAQMPLAAMIFLRGDVDVARNTVHVGVSTVDAFGTRRPRTSDRYSPYRVLPFLSKVRNAYFDAAYAGDADVVVSSGHSSSGDYRAARRAILFADWPYADVAATRPDRGASARASVPGLRTLPASAGAARPGALGMPAAPSGKSGAAGTPAGGEKPRPAGQVNVPLDPAARPDGDARAEAGAATAPAGGDTALDPASLPAGAQPIRAGKSVVGFWSDRLCVFPDAASQPDAAWLHRLYLAAARRWRLPAAADPAEAGRIFRSDTGQLVLDRERGIFTAVAPRARVATGFLGGQGPIQLGGVTIECRTAFASISIISLDGQPVERSRRLLITAVSRAENTGQATIEKHGALAEPGRTPIVAEPVDCRITLAGAGRLSACPLTPRAEKGEAARLKVERPAGALVVETAGARSPWLLVE